MDAIKAILAEYYWIFLIVGVVLLISLIGFIMSTKKKAKEQQPEVAEEPKEANTPEAPVAPQPTEAILDLTPAQTSQPYVEPSLDGLASSATEVKLGFDPNANSSSIFENEQPMLVIEDSATAPASTPVEPAVGLVIEEPVAQQEPAMLVIEDPAATQTAPVETAVQSVSEPEFGLVIEDPSATVQPVQTQPVEIVQAQPVEMVQPTPEPVQYTQPVEQPITQPVVEQVVAQSAVEQTVAQPAIQEVPVQPVAEPAAAPVEELLIMEELTETPAPVQPQPVVQQEVVQQVAPAPVEAQSAPVQAMPAPVQQPVQTEQQASIFESDAPTLVITDPSANQQPM